AEHDGGLTAVNIEDPEDPFQVGRVNFGGADFYSVQVVEEYAYVACGELGLIIFDVSQPDQMVQVGRERSGDYAVDVLVSGDYAYLALDHLGFAIIDISNPERPQLVRQYRQMNGNAQALLKRDDLIYSASLNNGVFIVDVSDPNNPVDVARIETPGDALGLAFSGDYLLVADNYEGLYVADISNPAEPRSVGFYDTPGNAVGVVCDGARAFVADYTNLGIYDISEENFVNNSDKSSPVTMMLMEAYPNPFNGTVNLKFGLPTASEVSLSIYNPLGQMVKSLYAGRKPAGEFTASFNSGDLPTGAYYAKLSTPNATISRKITLLK
ncbi:MAG: T9SS type A sorting domain-containing protein, partial [Calditrichaeota bacterium]|nr:T9SS type A sorting domain-containing protein [Calditrichota bacterium]